MKSRQPRRFAGTTIGPIGVALVALSILIAVVLPLAACGGKETTTSTTPASEQIKTPHFVDSYPLHEEVFAQTPELVVVNFDFDLGGQSVIQVAKNGVAVTAGPTEIFNDNLSMRVPLAGGTDGIYQVSYTAYWPDGTSHDGSFSFSADSTTRSGYADLTGEQVVTIDMLHLTFEPARVIIAQGTTVTWSNKEDPEHFVNTDPHPSHNALPELNSRGLLNGETYSFTFDQPGEWGYHCSAHYPQMVGRVIVVAAGGGATTASSSTTSTSLTTTTSVPTTTTQADVAGPPLADIDHLRTPHFVSSTPPHGATVDVQPQTISIDFNFDLGSQSTISVSREEVDVTAGGTSIAVDRLSMSVPLKPDSGLGTFLVVYRAYWPDGSYHDGQFAFAVE